MVNQELIARARRYYREEAPGEEVDNDIADSLETAAGILSGVGARREANPRTYDTCLFAIGLHYYDNRTPDVEMPSGIRPLVTKLKVESEFLPDLDDNEITELEELD